MAATPTDVNTAAAANGEPPNITGADSKLLHAIFQNMSGKVDFDVEAVAALLGLSIKTVRNRWCEMRGRYKWSSANGASSTPAKARGRAGAKGDSAAAGRVVKKRAPVTRKKVPKKTSKAPTPAASSDDYDSEQDIKPKVKSEPKVEPKSEPEDDSDEDVKGVKEEQ